MKSLLKIIFIIFSADTIDYISDDRMVLPALPAALISSASPALYAFQASSLPMALTALFPATFRNYRDGPSVPSGPSKTTIAATMYSS